MPEIPPGPARQAALSQQPPAPASELGRPARSSLGAPAVPLGQERERLGGLCVRVRGRHCSDDITACGGWAGEGPGHLPLPPDWAPCRSPNGPNHLRAPPAASLRVSEGSCLLGRGTLRHGPAGGAGSSAGRLTSCQEPLLPRDQHSPAQVTIPWGRCDPCWAGRRQKCIWQRQGSPPSSSLHPWSMGRVRGSGRRWREAGPCPR